MLPQGRWKHNEPEKSVIWGKECKRGKLTVSLNLRLKSEKEFRFKLFLYGYWDHQSTLKVLCFCQDDFSICVSTKGMNYTFQFIPDIIQTLLCKLEIAPAGLQLTYSSVSLLNKLDGKDPKSTVRRHCIVLHIRKLSIFFKSCHSYSSQIPTTEQCEPRSLDLPGHEVISTGLCLLTMRWEERVKLVKEYFVIFQHGEGNFVYEKLNCRWILGRK